MLNSKQNRKYYDEITIAKGIGIFLAVVGHAFPDAVKNFNIAGGASFASFIFYWIYSFHMSVFFFCAGFLLIPKLATIGNTKKYVVKKFKRLMVPYFFYSFLYLILKSFFGAIADHPLQGNDFWMLFLGDSPCFGAWFLWTLFVISFLCIMLRGIGVIPLLIISVIFFLIPEFMEVPSYISRISGNMIWVLLGGVLAINYEKFANLKHKAVVGIALMLSLTALHLLLKIDMPLIPLLKRFIGVSGVLLISFEIAYNMGNNMIRKVCSLMGDYCMDIYLLSMYVLVPLRIAYVNVGLMNYIPYWIEVLIGTALGIAIPYLVAKMIVRKNKILSMLLIGV